MVEAMAKSNLSQQQQSTSTPFMTEPLLTDFGYLANDKAAQEVLNGTYVPPPNTSKYVIEFLATLVIPELIKKLGPVDLTISNEITLQAVQK